MNRLFVRNDAKYRLIRTIIESVIAVFTVGGTDYIMQIVAHTPIPDWFKPILVCVIIAILTPIGAMLGTDKMEKEDVPHGYFEKEGEGNGDSEGNA